MSPAIAAFKFVFVVMIFSGAVAIIGDVEQDLSQGFCEEHRDSVVHYLEQSPDGLTQSELESLTGARDLEVSVALSCLEKDGVIRSRSTGFGSSDVYIYNNFSAPGDTSE